MKKYKQLHRKLWIWLAKNTDKEKKHWFDKYKHRYFDVVNQCFICEYVEEVINPTGLFCYDCPTTDIACILFAKWDLSRRNSPERNEYARRIAYLDWRENENIKRCKG